MEREEILIQNIKEFLRAGRREKNDDSFNSAATLFFKAIAVLADLFILKKERYIPSSHTERFRLLKEKYPFIYEILDKDFPIYQDSYRLKISEQLVGVLENDFKKIVEFTKIKID